MTSPTPPTLLGNITIADVYVKQIEINGQLEVIREQLKDLPDHEKRIRTLETARAKLIGASAAVSAFVSGAATWVGLVVTRH
jgi:hypothetical protein